MAKKINVGGKDYTVDMPDRDYKNWLAATRDSAGINPPAPLPVEGGKILIFTQGYTILADADADPRSEGAPAKK